MPPSSAASSRPIFGRILGHCPVELWGLSAAERLRRQFAAAGIARALDDGEAAPAGAAVVLVRADFLFDQRTLASLVARPASVVRTIRGRPVAAHVDAERADEVAGLMLADRAVAVIPGLDLQTAESLSSAYVQNLLKADRPLLAQATAERRALLEKHLFEGSYKGITDLVTKWLWPAPAALVVRACVRFGIRPNAVTSTSFVLVLLALGLFGGGWFGTGLALGWLMTFLDTVDGKLARVTLTSSPLGHAMDKGLDIVHPPLWYIAFGIGAAGATGGATVPDWVIESSTLMLVGYVGGRLLEGAFDFIVGRFPIYSWQPIDSWVRLVIARRNPNLLWLSGFWLLGMPALGVKVVTWWTLLSTVYLVVRLAQAGYARATGGPLESWLTDADSAALRGSLTARTFTSASARVRGQMERWERDE